MIAYPKAPDKWFNDEITKGRGIFDRKSYERAIRHVKNFDLAIDVGAHVGTWSLPLSSRFKRVISIEPDQTNVSYFSKNTHGIDNIEIINAAAGFRRGRCSIIEGPRNSGQWHVDENGDAVEMIKLDDIATRADFIKFDVEGFEFYAMTGGLDLLRKSRAVVVFEDNGLSESRYGIPISRVKDLLKDCGYAFADRVKYDEIWKKEC